MVADPAKAHLDSSKAHLELLEALGQSVPRTLDIPRARRIFVNRNLRMDEIDLIGFDMDYTLALYHQRNLEALSIQCTLDKLIAKRGYPEEIRKLDFDPSFAVRGLVVDRRFGNIFKADRYGHVGRVYHGRTVMSREERHRLYRLERIRLSSTRYAWIDTLFALPEAVMYSAMIDFFERKGGPVRFGKIWQDIRECIDEAHRDESMKRIIKANLGDYIVKDPELAPTLHKFRSSGKRLFVLTNSAWDYTDAVMTHLLGAALPAYANWRSYFDIVIVAGSKPAFFTDKNPFLEIDAAGNVKGQHAGPFARNRIYQGGNIHDFEAAVGVRGDHVLYIGDHIYGDMLRAKKSSVWRTAMILQELESELTAVENNKERLERVEHLERQLVRLDSEISYQQMLLKSLQKLAEAGGGGDAHHDPLAHAAPTVDAAKHEAKRRLDELRAALKQAADEVSENDQVIDRAFNPYWGAIFREAAENSRFGQQVEDYACVYTSRVSNFLAYSPLRYFRSPRDHMPHELV
ncbi:MAG TPA: HAD-IG family 5'-nucleotidase [Polyangia bacterium]